MSRRPHDTDHAATAVGESRTRDGEIDVLETAHRFARYDTIEVGHGQLIVYDTENQQAWIQSGAAVALDAVA